MTTPETRTVFPRTTGRTKGYDPAAVDAFLGATRDAFERADAAVTSATIREVGFPLVRRGYDVPSIDAALGRIEDAFAARERADALASLGREAWVARTREDAQVVLDRLTRPRGRRFTRARGLVYGYHVDEVDLVADRVASYLSSGADLTVEQVRGVAFRLQRRGYSEAQVDALLDAVVEIMLAAG